MGKKQMNKIYSYNKDRLPRPVLSEHPEWIELYDCAWKTAFRNIDYINKPNWKPQLTCYPGIGVIWQWDSCFMTLITNYSNGELSAFNNLDNLYRLQRPQDGYISMAYRIENETEAYDKGRINPPLYAWAEWEHYAVTGDSSRFETVLPKIEALYRYIEKNHRRSSGLYWFNDTGSSGMDNSPRGEYPSANLDGSGVCHIDLACQQSLSAAVLGNMFSVTGDTEKAEYYRQENKRINSLINRYHWNEKTGFYYDFFSRSEAEQQVKLINTKTVAAAWTMLCGAAEGERFNRVLEHFMNPDEFNTLIPFASLSRDDLNYDPKGGYWLGGAWPPVDYVILRAIENHGLGEIAKNSAEKILSGMYQVYSSSEYGGIWETYSPEEYKPATTENGELCKSDFVGWGGLIPVTALIESVIGFKFNAPANTVEFNISGRGDIGIENMHFAGGKISIVVRGYDPSVGSGKLHISAEKPFVLKLNLSSGKSAEIKVKPGESVIEL